LLATNMQLGSRKYLIIVDTNLTPTQANTGDISLGGLCLFAGISEHQRTTTTLCSCLRMAEVTSSSLVGSTPKIFSFAGKT
jgi:hypothetical protein